MKILILANSESFILNFKLDLIKLLSLNNSLFVIPFNKVKAISLGIDGSDYLRISRRSKNPIKELLLIKDIFSHIIYQKPDVVMTFTVKPNVYSGMITRLLGIYHIQVITGLGTALQSKSLYLSAIVRNLYRLSVHSKTINVFENLSNLEYFNNNRISRENLLVNGSGVNLSVFNFHCYPIHNETKFIFVGRIMREKGIFELLIASESIFNDGYKFHLTIIGKEDENIDLSKWRNKTWLRFEGYTSDIITHYISSHAIIHPSHHEGMSNVLLEAASIGRPAIASNIPGCYEIVEHGITGFLFEKENVDELKKSITSFLELSYNKKKQMGQHARDRVEKLFNRNEVDQKYVDLIDSIKQKLK
jgi:glycosyltransferase involved in cell wall biosynthesis